MKKTKSKAMLVLMVLACISTLGLAQLPMGQPGPASPAAAPAGALSMSDAILQVVVGDLPGFISRVDAMGAQLQPNRAPGDSLKAKLGAMLGDPTLAGLTAGSGAVILMFPDNTSVMMVEAAPEQLQKYKDSITSLGMVLADVADGVLVVSKTQNGLTSGKAMATAAKAQFLAGVGKPEAEASLLLTKVLAKFDPMINQMMQSLPMMLSMQQGGAQQDPAAMQKQARAAELQIRGLLSFVRQIDVIKLGLQIPEDSVRVNLGLVPRANTDLARYAATGAKEGANLMALLPAKGAVRGVISYDADVLMSLLEKQATSILQQMSAPPAEQQALLETLRLAKGAYAGQTAMDFVLPGQGLLSGSVLQSVKDPAGAMALLEKTSELTSSALTQGAGGMSLKGQFTKNVRQYKGAEIGQVSIQTKATGAAQQAIPNLDAKFDVAVVNNILVQANGAGNMEKIIDAIQANANPEAKPLNAAAKFPAGGAMYMDIDVAAMLGAVVPMLQNMPMAQGAGELKTVAAKLQGAPPISMAGYCDAQGLRLNTMIPKEMIARFAKTAAAPAAPAAAPRPAAGAPVPAGAR